MFWFRYLNTEPVRVGMLTLNPREVYAISYVDSTSMFIVHNEKEDKTLINDASFIDTLLSKSRSVTTKTTIERATSQKIIDLSKPEVPIKGTVGDVGNKFQVSTNMPKVTGGKPSIPKSFPLPLRFADKTIIYDGDRLNPILGEYEDAVKQSMSYLGTKHVAQAKKFLICSSITMPTCLLRVLGANGKLHGDVGNFIILNFSQLQRIAPRGKVDVAFIAQVITHEYAHYKFHSGVVKQTDVIKFRKLLGARGLHPDVFNHPGYSYPWYEEAWAVLCEYMVHGHSARGLACTEGWEIAAKYFDNNYLKGGMPTGAPMVAIK